MECWREVSAARLLWPQDHVHIAQLEVVDTAFHDRERLEQHPHPDGVAGEQPNVGSGGPNSKGVTSSQTPGLRLICADT
jgi:hypothetical protein